MMWLRLHTADLNAPVEKPEHTTSVEKSSLIARCIEIRRAGSEIAARVVEIATSRFLRVLSTITKVFHTVRAIGDGTN